MEKCSKELNQVEKGKDLSNLNTDLFKVIERWENGKI